MAATAGHRLTLGNCSNMNLMRYGVNVNETTSSTSNCIGNAYFSETISHTASKLHRNVHWIVLSWISNRHKKKIVEAHQMNIPEKFGFNCPSGFSKEVF
jgi:hypothetical protein